MSLIKNSSIYLFSNIINAVIPFLLLPILTRVLTSEEYGQIAMFQTLIGGLAAFIGFSAHGAANRKFFDNISSDELKVFNGACVYVLLISSLAVGVLIFATSDLLVNFLNIPKDWLIFAVFMTSFNFIVQFRLSQYQIRNNAKMFGIVQVSRSLLNVSLSLFFVVILIKGSEGRIEAQLISSFVFVCIAIFLLYKDELVKFKSSFYIKDILNFGVPLVPHLFGFFLLNSIDRFIINDKFGLSVAGIYMVAVQLSMALSILFDALNKAFTPWLFSSLKENDDKTKSKIVKYTYLYMLFLLFFAGLAFLIGPYFIIFIVGDKYSAAADIIGWLCLGQIFAGMYLMVTNYVFYARKTGQLSIVTIICGVLNVIILLLLVDDYGLDGAAISFAISKFIQFIMTWLLAIRVQPMPWFQCIAGEKK